MGIVRAQGARADEDRIHLGTQPMSPGARRWTAQPAVLARRTREPAIQRERGLGDHPGSPGDDPTVERPVQRLALGVQHTGAHGDSRRLQDCHGFPGVTGIRIGRADDHPRETGTPDGVRARWGAAVGRAGLQGDVDRRPPRAGFRTERLQRLDLRMRLPRPVVIPPRQHAPVFDDHRAHRRVRAGVAPPPLRFAQRHPHETRIGVRFVRRGSRHESH